MDSGVGESMGPYFSGSSSNDTGDFECNICFELAQDPIVTLCGHLYCWPCLYRWLQLHSYSHECPVCKALIQEEKLVPIYGRGKTSLDPRSQSIPGVDIPNRPAGQRPETAPAPDANPFDQDGFGLRGRNMPVGTARVGNLRWSSAFGGLIQSLNLQAHGFHDATIHRTTTTTTTTNGFPYPPYRSYGSFHGGHAHWFYHRHSNRGQRRNSILQTGLLFIGLVVIFALILPETSYF
uniref:E3 ubiquitin-protein ligase RMA n=1 Tax=Davidia involucrata TaxID=16924 RepID=A0A5B7A8E4_DAVIN